MHPQGNRTPHTDPHSRGAFAGLALKHRRGHLWRALLESVAFGTAVILQAMGEAGFSPDSIAIAGGATHSELWLQVGLTTRHKNSKPCPMRNSRWLSEVVEAIKPQMRRQLFVAHRRHTKPLRPVCWFSFALLHESTCLLVLAVWHARLRLAKEVACPSLFAAQFSV